MLGGMSDEAVNENANGDGHIETGQRKATLLAMIIVVALRKWLERNRNVRLVDDDADELLEEIDDTDEGLGIIGSLQEAASRFDAGSGPAELALLLTHIDPDQPFEVHDEIAGHDADCLAAGIYARLTVAAYGFESAVERQAMTIHLGSEDGAAYGREILLNVLIDIRELLTLQHEMEAKHRNKTND